MNLEDPSLWRFGDPPVEPRLAATVLCARPRGEGFEILMIKRPEKSGFASHQFVFPGGKVDSADTQVLAREVAPLPLDFTYPLPLRNYEPEIQEGVYRAALRELAEEVGYLVTQKDIVSSWSGEFATAGEFYRLLKLKGFILAPERLIYWINWVTPEAAPVRFDTHFFLLFLPQGLEPRPSAETVELIWFHPREALKAFQSGAIELMFPTFKSLEQLAALKSLYELERFVAHFPQLRIEPRVVSHPDTGITIELPETWPDPQPWM